MAESMLNSESSIELRLKDVTGVQEAIRQAREAALQRHRAANRRIPRWCDGRVEWVEVTAPQTVTK